LRDLGVDIDALMPRQALHAAVLGIAHPVSGKPLHFRSELPRDMIDLVNALSALPRRDES
jgi:23S rRNA pseudouridine1911/1915/1917 synthase